MTTRIKHTVFNIATSGGGRATRKGYVLGDYATHKDRYSWTYTHIPTGVSISAPWIETKAPALEHLRLLATEGPAEHQVRVLAEHGHKWGLGL